MKIINRIKNKLVRLRIELSKESSEEKYNRGILITSIQNLSKNTITDNDAWSKYRRRLRFYILGTDPRNFLRWEPVVNSMVPLAQKCELIDLQNKNWDKWSFAIIETWVGNPPPCSYYKKSSGTLIHNAYNLSQLISRHNVDVRTVNSVVEFGASYGCMARLVFNLGFTGKYAIFDIPEFLALQKYYLQSTNTKGNIDFTEELNALTESDPDILIATWSLSESPIELRNKFLNKIGKPRYILIAYQKNFESTDNIHFFGDYQKNNPEYEWTEYEIPHLPGNYYLIGRKNNQNIPS